jgi:hypothetical protein
VHAQAPKYAFTRIADTNTDPDLGSVSCVGLNDLGTVALTFTNGGVNELWRGNGVTFTKVAEKVGGLCFSINNQEEFAYVTNPPPPGPLAKLVRNSNGVLTTLASSDTWPFLDGGSRMYLPSLNNSGHAV